MLVSGPLSAESDERTVERATEVINRFLDHLRLTNVARWDSGRKGGFCVNVGIRAMLLLLAALIEHAKIKQRGFDPANATPEEIVDEAGGSYKITNRFP